MAIGDTINTSTLTQTFDSEFGSFVSSADGSTGLWRTSLINDGRTLSGNGEQEYYSDSTVGENPFSVQNGVLDIQATKAAPGSNPLGLPYDSGVITTEDSFNQLYGYFEIDAKLPAGQGLWPAFWLVPASGAWPPELDVFEVLGNNPSTLYFTTHSGVQPTLGTTLTVPNTSTGFNLYGVMWGPQTVSLYINNVEVASLPTPPDMDVPMYMLANLAVGGYWPGDPNSSTTFPANMQISYIKAFAYPGTTGGTVYDTTPAQNIGPAALAPVVSMPASAAATTGAASTLHNISVASNWPGGFFTIVISDTSGLLRTAATADVFTTGEGTNELTLTGNLAPLNAALAGLTYQGAAAGSEWVWVSATDPQGLESASHVVVTDSAGTTPPVITPPAGTAPVVTAPASLTLAARATGALTGISITDSKSSGTFTVTLSDTTGLLKAATVSGVTVQGDGTTELKLSGGLTAINTELASLTYQAGAIAGTDWVWVSADDASGDQGLGHTTVTVTAQVASVPIVTTPASLTLAADTSKAVTGVSVADSQSSGTFSVVVSDSTGLLSVGAIGGVTVQGDGTTYLKLSGSLASINADLSSLTYQAGTAKSTEWLWVSADDASGNQGLGHVVVSVAAPVVTLPVITTPSTATLAAGATTAISGVTATDGQASDGVSVTVSDSTGLLRVGSVSGVTVQGDGTSDLKLSGSLAAINTDLKTLTYQAGSAGTDWLWVSADDAGGNQGLGHTVVTVTAKTQIAKTAVVKTEIAKTEIRALTAEAATPAPCFCAGTRIVTDRGNVAVEALRVGDLVKTSTRGFQPVTWIGTRVYEGHAIAGNHLALPVRIRRHALGHNVPSRDLHVSPDHAICEGGVLIPAWRLINGVSITQAERVERVAYFHVELARHSVIFAENCPVESFIDANCRTRFQNAASAPAAMPQKSCLPVVADGFYLQRVQTRINRRAGITLASLTGALRGCIDETGPGQLRGWAQDMAAPDEAVELEIRYGGRLVARCLANRYREDLRRAGLGAGCHAFQLALPNGLAGPLSIRRAGDGAELGLSHAA